MDFSSSYVGLMEAYTSLMGCIVSSIYADLEGTTNQNTIVRKKSHTLEKNANSPFWKVLL